MGSAPSQPLNLGTEGLPAGRWVPRYGPGHSHPGGNGESLEEHRLSLAAERDPDAGEPLLRDSTWTNGQQRSSVWSGSYEAPRCLSTFASDRFCSYNGSFGRRGGECRPRNGFGEWIVFDLKTEVDISKVRLVNYWSSRKSGDSCSFKEIVLETAPSVQGPFRVVSFYTDLPRCAVSKAVDLYIRARARVWRVRCTATHGGAGFGIYGIDFWRAAPGGEAGGILAGTVVEATGAPPPLHDIVDALKRNLGLEGTFAEVVDAACLQLGVAPTGNLQEKGAACWRAMEG